MQEISVLPWWFTPAFVILGFVGPFVGIFIGSHLTRSSQRRQWLADNRLLEWRELIATLLSSTEIIGKVYVKGATKTVEALTQAGEAETSVLRAIGSRIFINEDIKREDLHHHWSAVVEEFRSSQDLEKFGKQAGRMLGDLRQKAHHDIETL